MPDNPAIVILTKHGLKVTPQRIAILEVILNLKEHPTAETICNHLRPGYPNLSIATIYKTLDTFAKKGIIRKVLSETDTMRYDGVAEKHHHLYSTDSGRIEDYYDEDLNKVIENYLKRKRIPNFTIEDFKLQLFGKFTDKQ
ncbi:MAG: transcriptional repressor [Bacteroidales bacterium]|nr:transcriptional repressor [Bacteroidales bacterium]